MSNEEQDSRIAKWLSLTALERWALLGRLVFPSTVTDEDIALVRRDLAMKVVTGHA
jgi:hypothetical protein